MSPNWPLMLIAAPMGAAAGSFVVTAAIRRSRDEPYLAGRSHCDSCGVSLGALQTVPILSYSALGGACRTCGAPIARLHLMGEVAGLVTAVCAVSVHGAVRQALLAIMGLALLASAFIDVRERRLPDGLTIVIAVCGFVLALRTSGHAFLAGGLAALATFAVLEALRRLSMTRGRAPGLGFGDVKLFTALALWLGAATPWAAVVAAVLGLAAMSVLRPSDGRLAFGPMIAAGAWFVGMAGEWGMAPWLR